MMQSLTPTEVFERITHDRVLLIKKSADAPIYLQGVEYIRKIDDDAYRWFSKNIHDAIIGSWTWPAGKTRQQIRVGLEADYCIGQEFVQYSDLKDGTRQSLRDPDYTGGNNE